MLARIMPLYIIMLIISHEKRETFPSSGRVKILDDICKWNQAIKVLSLPSCSALFPWRQCDVTSGLSAFRSYFADRWWQRYCHCLAINLHTRFSNDLFVWAEHKKYEIKLWNLRVIRFSLLFWLNSWKILRKILNIKDRNRKDRNRLNDDFS